MHVFPLTLHQHNHGVEILKLPVERLLQPLDCEGSNP